MRIGLALSGGGLRATLFHLGVVRALRDSGTLKDVTHICSVSGGSILAAHLVLHWEDYLGDKFEARAAEILDFCSFDVRNRIVRRYPSLFVRWLASKLVPFGLVSAAGPTDLLQGYYHRLYGDATIEDLRGASRPKLQILTTNVTTGTLCSFGGDGYESEAAAATGRRPYAEVKIPAATPTVAFAVTASSAFPGMFSPIRLTAEGLGKFDAAEFQPAEQFITDGGVYDNLGVRKFLNAKDELKSLDRVFVSNASLELKTNAGRAHVGMLKTALRASDLLSHRVHQLEVASMQGTGDGKFVAIHINEVVPRTEEPEALHENTQEWLRWMRTDLDRFSSFEKHCLVRHGWTVARRALRTAAIAKTESASWNPVDPADVPANPIRQVKSLVKSVSRSVRPFGLRDPISWVHACIIVAIVGLAFPGYWVWENIRRPLQIRALEGEIAARVAKQQHRLSTELTYRRTVDGTSFWPEAAQDTQRTESSYIALVALDALISDEAQHVRQGLRSHFIVLGSAFAAPDYDESTGAWKEPWDRTGQSVVQPSLFGLSLVGRLLQGRGLTDPQRDTLLVDMQRLTKSLGRFYLGNGKWRIFADQAEEFDHPLIQALAVKSLLEMRKGMKSQGFVQFDKTVLHETARHLVETWRPPKAGEPAGWTLVTKEGKSEVCTALTLQIYAYLLRAEEADPAIAPMPAAMIAEIGRRIASLRETNDADYIEDHHVKLATGPEGPKTAWIGLLYQWLPRALECTREWWRREMRLGVDREEVLKTLETVDRLTRDPMASFVGSADKQGTFFLAEHLNGLSLLVAP